MSVDIEKAETRAVELADVVWGRLAELYEIYYRNDADAARYRVDVEIVLSDLMGAYNGWLA